MAEMNILRLLLAGLAAGLTSFLLTGAVNATLLAAPLKQWMATTGSTLHPPTQAVAMGLWALMALLLGIAGVWLYAVLALGLGNGFKTALMAGFVIWLVNKLAVGIDMTALGLFTKPLLVGLTLGGLLAIEASVVVGAWIYKG